MNITKFYADLAKINSDLDAGGDIQTAKIKSANANTFIRAVATHVKYSGDRAQHGDKMAVIQFFEPQPAKADAANSPKLKAAG